MPTDVSLANWSPALKARSTHTMNGSPSSRPAQVLERDRTVGLPATAWRRQRDMCCGCLVCALDAGSEGTAPDVEQLMLCESM